ncbi:MAG: putative porin [Deltaproteobacteria bacterium]|nr:putative porin [Deltaproteobacteria bacterium]
MTRPTSFMITMSFLCLLLCSTAAWAKESEPSFDSIEALVEILQQKGVMSREEAQRFVDRYRKHGGPPPGRVVRLIPEEKEMELAERIAQDVTARVTEDLKKVKADLHYASDDLMQRSRNTNLRVEQLEKKVTEDVEAKLRKSSWAQRIRWGGDIRLRYQADYFDENNADLLKPDNPTELMNTKEDRKRYRGRLRLAAVATLLEDREVNVGKVEVGVGIATGNEKDPVSTNDTFGDYYNKDGIMLDLAYLKWTYKPELPIWDKIPEISLIGGRMPNPFYSTDLVWDQDLRLEGFALGLKTDTLDSNPWKGHLTLGAFPLQEEEFTQDDKWLYAGQAGVAYRQAMGLSFKLGVALYDYKNIVGMANDPFRPNLLNWTAPQFQQKGNTLFDIDPTAGIRTALASEYKLLNVTGILDYDYWFPIHIMLTGDYVKNRGFDVNDVSRRTGNPNVKEETTGYQVGLTVGYPQTTAFGEWNLSLFYKYLEADAVLDAFTDSDFHLGGTNAEGWILGGQLGVYKNVWLRMRWFGTDEIEGPPLAIDTLQVDLNAKF